MRDNGYMSLYFTNGDKRKVNYVNIIVHDGYDTLDMDYGNDIAVVQFKEKVSEVAHVTLRCIDDIGQSLRIISRINDFKLRRDFRENIYKMYLTKVKREHCNELEKIICTTRQNEDYQIEKGDSG